MRLARWASSLIRVEWVLKDSNLRRQSRVVYSHVRLATPASTLKSIEASPCP